MENRGVNAIRIFHHDTHRFKYTPTYDEGKPRFINY